MLFICLFFEYARKQDSIIDALYQYDCIQYSKNRGEMQCNYARHPKLVSVPLSGFIL
jgi:hypothetical protein